MTETKVRIGKSLPQVRSAYPPSSQSFFRALTRSSRHLSLTSQPVEGVHSHPLTLAGKSRGWEMRTGGLLSESDSSDSSAKLSPIFSGKSGDAGRADDGLLESTGDGG